MGSIFSAVFYSYNQVADGHLQQYVRGSYTVDKFSTESVKIIIISQPIIHVTHYLCGSGSS